MEYFIKPIRPFMATITLLFCFCAVAVSPSAGQVEAATSSLDAEEVMVRSLADTFNDSLAVVNNAVFSVLFWDISFGLFKRTVTDPVSGETSRQGPGMPMVVVFLALGALFYTFYHRFINIRAFRHAWQVVRGKYEHEDHEGDITPFRALTSALSATVGLGNIAGVGVAMVIGGPGALFWMMVLGLFGMTSKFHESTLAQLYRIRNADDTFSGGPMFYLSKGIADLYPRMAWLGKIMALLFAVCLMFASLGGGNMFQANQAYEGFFTIFVQPNLAAEDAASLRETLSYGFGILMAGLVGFVVLGGITRIGAATSRLVPFMAGLYVSACAIILFLHMEQIPGMLALVMQQAFSMDSAYGGVIGAMMIGFQRAAFSSEAGLGSSAVAHAAAKTDEPAREGMVASLEPFIDTIVVCFMTGMVVLVTGAYAAEVQGGAAVTLHAFQQTPWINHFMPYVLSVCIILFAFSTMLAWCYYGERAWGYLFGIRSVIIFRLVFVAFVFIGTVSSLDAVIDFADAALLSTAIPNIVGGILLAPLVKKTLDHYWQRYRSGEMDKPTQDFEV